MKIDPDAQKVMDAIKASGRPKFDTLSAPEARAAYRDARKALSPDPIDIADWHDLEAPSSRGAIPLRFYRGTGAPQKDAPCLIYIHGGGYVIGDRDTHDHVCRKLANESRGAVVSVDYRLAPENKFPGPVEDCATAARWIASQAFSLGIDPKRLAVGGDSAGGNLSAVLALMSREGDGPAYVHQALLYPGTNLAIDYKPGVGVGANADLPLTNSLTNWFHAHYFASPGDRTDWRASAFHAKSHEGSAAGVRADGGARSDRRRRPCLCGKIEGGRRARLASRHERPSARLSDDGKGRSRRRYGAGDLRRRFALRLCDGGGMTRRLISSGSRFESEIGYSCAVVDGDFIFVSGCTGYDYATMALASGVVAQCEQAMRNLGTALTEAGASFANVVRVQYILPRRADFEACWPVLRRCFRRRVSGRDDDPGRIDQRRRAVRDRSDGAAQAVSCFSAARK